MSENRGIEVSTNQSNPTEIPGGLGMPYQISLLTGLFITITLMVTATINIAFNNRVRNALDKKLVSIQERLLYIQGNYIKYVNEGKYVYYDPKIRRHKHFIIFNEKKKQVQPKKEFYVFLRSLAKTLNYEKELRLRSSVSGDSVDGTLDHLKIVGRYIDPDGLYHNIELEYISSGNSGNATNWIVSLSDNENT